MVDISPTQTIQCFKLSWAECVGWVIYWGAASDRKPDTLWVFVSLRRGYPSGTSGLD